jgi:hypothetical protein
MGIALVPTMTIETTLFAVISGSESEVSPRNKQVSNFKRIWNIHGIW